MVDGIERGSTTGFVGVWCVSGTGFCLVRGV